MPTLKTITRVLAGRKHGPINRLISPDSSSGDILKPFVFLDFVRAELPRGFGFPFHPHSGIGTVTYQLNTDVSYVDTEGESGILKKRGIEWMKAGGGAWHKAQFPEGGSVLGFQLWLPLPPGKDGEDGPSFSQYVPPEQVQKAASGKMTVLLGEYEDAQSQVSAPYPVNYFDIELGPNDDFLLKDIPVAHDVSWAFIYKGKAKLNANDVPSEQLLVLSKVGDAVQFQAVGDGECRILFGSAPLWEHALNASGGSIHTNEASLMMAERKIQALGEKYRGSR